MTRILYIDAFSGISGDMLLAAFLDAGLPLELLETNFRTLNLPEPYQLSYKSVMKGAIQAGHFQIDLISQGEQHHTHHHHRHMSDIRQLIVESELSVHVKEDSLSMFETLAKAEGKIHGVEPEKVHFHEVGATDSILDIVGISVALEYFQIDEVYCSSLPWSEGSVTTQHGEMPLPAPATLALLTECKAPMRPFSATMELVTPTGAAFLAAFAKFEKPAMRLEQQGSGAGSKELPWPNILRVIIGESMPNSNNEHVVIETNIDDMNPEWYGHLMERCFAVGALDVAYEQIFMKKNRPATRITIIANRNQEAQLAELLLQETTTFGVRVYPVSRYEAQRDFINVRTEWGEVRVKRKWWQGKVIQCVPEYEDCRRIAQDHQIPIPEVLQKVMQALKK
ncbi:MAG TPA: nickel pincer cofactor biosynthesis protein LarC [Anaerolineaceae bacterium]|nr:nickel pincer cofactor biosynthesis protein LarC [Anaerolineaceae bacterium]